MNVTWRRIAVVCSVGIYCAAVMWSYIGLIVPDFSYAGYTYTPIPPLWSALAIVLAVAPSFWAPIAFTRPSQVASWMLYTLVIIPCMIIPPHVIGYNPGIFVFLGVLCAAFISLGFIY